MASKKNNKNANATVNRDENKSADSQAAKSIVADVMSGTGYNPLYPNPTDKYDPENSEYYRQMQSLADSMSAAAANQTAYLNSRNKQDTQDASDAYTANARTAYINYLKQKNAANETLRNNGVNGGASETALLNIGNNYNRNVSTNDASRAAAIAGINTNYADAINQMKYENAMAIANMQSTYYQLAIQDMENRKQQDLENFYATNTNFKNKDAVKKAIKALDERDPLYDIKKAYLNNIKNDPNLKAAKKTTTKKTTTSSKSSGYSGGTGGKSVATNSNWKETYSQTDYARNGAGSKDAKAAANRKSIEAEASKKYAKYSPAWYGYVNKKLNGK